MKKGLINTGNISINVGDHTHLLEVSELSVDFDEEYSVLKLGLSGRTFSQIPVDLSVFLDAKDSKRLLRFLENRCSKI